MTSLELFALVTVTYVTFRFFTSQDTLLPTVVLSVLI